MATTPTPTPVAPGFWTKFANFTGITWVKTHEKLLITLVVCVAIIWGVFEVKKAWEDHDDKVQNAKLATLTQQATDDKTQAAALDAQRQSDAAAAAADKAQLTTVVNTVIAQNTALQAQMTARDKATTAQQQVDLKSSIGELNQRFSTLVPGVLQTDIVVSADGKTVTVGTDTAEKTVSQLELVPQLQGDLKDEMQTATNLQSEINSLNTYNKALEAEVNTANSQIAILNKSLTDEDAVWQQKLDIANGETKKAYWKGFKTGGIIGFIGGVALVIGAHFL